MRKTVAEAMAGRTVTLTTVEIGGETEQVGGSGRHMGRGTKSGQCRNQFKTGKRDTIRSWRLVPGDSNVAPAVWGFLGSWRMLADARHHKAAHALQEWSEHVKTLSKKAQTQMCLHSARTAMVCVQQTSSMPCRAKWIITRWTWAASGGCGCVPRRMWSSQNGEDLTKNMDQNDVPA
jgi:hypothetical protein